MANKIILTGGGSGGHVTPNQALIPELLKKGYEVHYIGSKNGIEKEMIKKEKEVTYHEISTGKLRRYFAVKNFTDPFKVAKGILDSLRIISKVKPNIIFSKGGFVALPVVIAAKVKGIPVIGHESDYTPGLANKLSKPYVKKLCVSFEETLKYVGDEKGIVTGTPIRREIGDGNAEKGKAFLKLKNDKPILLVMGGSLGAKSLNTEIRKKLKELTQIFNVIHLCGKGNIDLNIKDDSYRQYEYINEELKDVFKISDIILSRAGANTIFEILYVKKPNILVPLPGGRGDQILNAKAFESKGYSVLLNENELSEKLLDEIKKLFRDKEKYTDKMSKSEFINGKDKILEIIEKYKK